MLVRHDLRVDLHQVSQPLLQADHPLTDELLVEVVLYKSFVWECGPLDIPELLDLLQSLEQLFEVTEAALYYVLLLAVALSSVPAAARGLDDIHHMASEHHIALAVDPRLIDPNLELHRL
jgi:hypothetical protein